jgi:S1-C subfamily serine protease
VIISEDGFIVTNNHVIDEADEIKVTLSNKKSYTAKMVGTDPAATWLC